MFPPVYSSSDDDTSINNPFAALGPPNEQRDDDAHRWESSFELDLLEFNGGMEAEQFLDWLTVVEELLDFKEVPSTRRVALVATRFRGRVSAWWHQLRTTRNN